MLQPEPHKNRRVFHLLVALCDLVAAQRGLAPRAVRHDLVPPVKQPLLPNLLQRPPNRLNVSVLKSDVRRIHIQPKPHPLRRTYPLPLVPEDRVLALAVELFNSKLLNLSLAVQPQLLLNLNLNRQPVRVPARLPLHEKPLHRFVPQHEVFHYPRKNVSRVRQPVRSRRSLNKNKLLAALLLPVQPLAPPPFYALLKCSVFFPAVQDRLFQSHEIRSLLFASETRSFFALFQPFFRHSSSHFLNCKF